MTTQPDGSIACDRCGTDVGNGGVFAALVVSDLDAEAGLVRNLHFCRDRDGAKGCDKKILSPANLAHFLTSHDRYTQPSLVTPAEPEQPA